MKYLHTMVRVTNLEKSLDFYCRILGMQEVSRRDDEKGKYTNVFLKAGDDVVDVEKLKAPLLELTFNWEPQEYAGGRNFGHLCFQVENIYEFCDGLVKQGVIINRPPRDGRMAFIKSPDNISIEILQTGEALPMAEPWSSMQNTGTW